MSLRTMSRTILFYKNYQKFVKNNNNPLLRPQPQFYTHWLPHYMKNGVFSIVNFHNNDRFDIFAEKKSMK